MLNEIDITSESMVDYSSRLSFPHSEKSVFLFSVVFYGYRFLSENSDKAVTISLSWVTPSIAKCSFVYIYATFVVGKIRCGPRGSNTEQSDFSIQPGIDRKIACELAGLSYCCLIKEKVTG